MTPRRWLLVAVAGHVLLTALHGVVHLVVPVHVQDWQYGYAVVVAVLVPAGGAALVARDSTAAGAVVLALSGVAALAFEGVAHFVVSNPDHVGTVEAGRTAFALTAAFSTAGDATLVAAALWVCQRKATGWRLAATPD